LSLSQTTSRTSPSTSSERCVVVLPNNDWMLIYPPPQSLVTALSQVRLDNGDTLPIVRRFLLDQLKYNDNSTNNVRFVLYSVTSAH
jgi:hypothetical protein